MLARTQSQRRTNKSEVRRKKKDADVPQWRVGVGVRGVVRTPSRRPEVCGRGSR